MAVNLGGTRHVLEACRALPRADQAGVRELGRGLWRRHAGGPGRRHDPDPADLLRRQKAAGELLLNDYSRKGFVDGRALRLPTIVVRPGKPNKAASTFAS